MTQVCAKLSSDNAQSFYEEKDPLQRGWLDYPGDGAPVSSLSDPPGGQLHWVGPQPGPCE